MTRGNILVLDTNRDSLFRKAKAVLGERYQMVGAFTEKEAIAALRKERFDIVIAEIDPQDKAGLSLAERVRRNDPALAIVLLGEPMSIDIASRRLGSGPQAFLPQHFTAGELERAVEDALERRQLMRDNKRLKALLPFFEITKTLMSEVELDKLLEVVLEVVWQETEADSVSLMLLDDAEQELVAKACLSSRGMKKDGKEKVGEGIAGRVAKTAEPLMLSRETSINPDLERAMTRIGASSVLCLPLVVKGSVIGVLTSSKAKGVPFNHSDLELLSILCGEAAIAIENARLFSVAKTQQARVEQLLKQSIMAQEHERQRISMEIHDSVAQWMVAASYRIQALSRSLARNGLPQAETELSEIREAIDQSIKELRRVIVDLHPPALDELGLSEALHQNLQNFEPQRHRHFLSH